MSGNFGEDVAQLKTYVETIVLGGEGQAQIAVVPAYQGRVMTSSFRGSLGDSHGWINFQHIARRRRDPQINMVGGEERLWLAPEGGQYSLFFDPDQPFEFSHWRTPSLIDTDEFEIESQTTRQIVFRRAAKLINYARFTFDLEIVRTINLLGRTEIAADLGIHLPTNVQVVAHASHNRLVNSGLNPWVSESGLLSLWSLNLLKPAADVTVVVPFHNGLESERGPIVNADYFGKLDSSRLVVDENAGAIFFLGDGRCRSKIGLSFSRAKPVLGSWSRSRGTLTIAKFNLPLSAPTGYTNNIWSWQDHPFAGDVVNSYNDGPNDSGGVLGPFYELETLSPALALGPQESYTHIHQTAHFSGPRTDLNQIAQHVFGVSLERIESVFSKREMTRQVRK